MDFLRESWGELAHNQNNTFEAEKETDPELERYFDLEKTITSLPHSVPQKEKKAIQRDFEDLQESIKDYVKSVNAHKHKDFTSGNIKEVKSYSKERQLSHDAVFNDIKSLKARMEAQKLDTSWSYGMTNARHDGTDRDTVTEWALTVMNYIGNKGKRKEEDED